MEAGVDGLLRDKTRPPGKPPLPDEQVAEVVVADADAPPHEATHWTGAADGRGLRHQRVLGAAHLEGAWPGAAPRPQLQALQRSRLRREAARHRRALCRPARPCRGAVGRREVPDPGARPHPARPADEEGPGRHHDPRLQAQRHHHAVRRAQRARRHGDRPQHAAPPAPGVHPLPQRHRARRPGRQGRPRHPRQLRRPQARPRCAPGSPATRAGPSTSPRPRAPGSTPSRASSPSSPAAASNAASSNPSSTSRPPSTASSPSTTEPPSPSSGAPIPAPSSPLETEGSKRWINPLSCSPLQGFGTRIFSLALASVSFEWPPLCKAGGTVNETTVDHALIRGLGTAGPDASWSCLGLGSSVGWNARLIVDTRVLLP